MGVYFNRAIKFKFEHRADRFFVEEYLPFKPKGRGDFLILKVKKRDMTTFNLISIFKSATNLNERDIGYAGLKDKNATTIQYISIPISAQKCLKNIKSSRITILDMKRDSKPIKRGYISHNYFEILLTEVSQKDADIFRDRVKFLSQNGIPNFFGYQRFGESGESWKQGRDIANSGKRLRGSRERLLVSAWQSKLFNDWLNERIKIGKIIDSNSVKKASNILQFPPQLVAELKKQRHLFKIFIGDIMKRGNIDYQAIDILKESEKFLEKRVTPTGLLSGFKAKRAVSDARYIEEQFDDEDLISLAGGRREAWIYPTNISIHYNGEERKLLFSFNLPKGAYATTLLEEIGGFKLQYPT